MLGQKEGLFVLIKEVFQDFIGQVCRENDRFWFKSFNNKYIRSEIWNLEILETREPCSICN